MPYTNIIVAIDGSQPADDALEQAIMLIRESYSSQLKIVHVYQFPNFVLGEAIIGPSASQENDIFQYAQSVVNKAEARVKDIALAEVMLKYGNPAKTILEYAEEIQSDLIIVGSRGHGGIRGFMLGSVSHNIVQHAKVPVLVVK